MKIVSDVFLWNCHLSLCYCCAFLITGGARRSWLRPLFWILCFFHTTIWKVHDALREFITNLVRRRSLGAIYKTSFSRKEAAPGDTAHDFVDYFSVFFARPWINLFFLKGLDWIETENQRRTFFFHLWKVHEEKIEKKYLLGSVYLLKFIAVVEIETNL